jgi:transcriptional regulator with XRE-family HTH domain
MFMKTWNSQRAKDLIHKSGLRKDFLAAKCGVKTASLGNVLLGVKPGPRLLRDLAQLLGTTPEYLNFQTDDPRPKGGEVA